MPLTPAIGTLDSILGHTQILGPITSVPPNTLPSEPPFDIYCVTVGEPLLTYIGVSFIGNPVQFPIGPSPNFDQEIFSGGVTYPPDEAAVIINVDVPEDWTLQFTALWQDLPNDFSDLVGQHSYFGASAPAGACAGLFFSKVGIAYTGSIHFDSGNNIVIDTQVQELPGSQFFVSENDYWTMRLAVSLSTGVVYVYVTLTSELAAIGHQLRYILPVIPSANAAVTPPSDTVVSVCGTAGNPTYLSLNELCLGTGLIIPALPPVANAGNDTSIILCSILQLNGSASFDPQGGALTYLWQLIDAPSGSQFIFNGTDGLTFPGSPPTGFTNKLYSVSLAAVNVLEPIAVGDVLVLQGLSYTITAVGSDAHGFFAEVMPFELPDNLTLPTTFNYVRQNGLNTPISEDPTFYPDVLGIFKFSLVVNDGLLSSLPAEVIANVVESDVARGCVSDLTFLWNYLSDFWNLVDGTERISVFWQGLAQVAGAELLNLWQVDYSKSLRDIQRTFQRRWLHYDLLMQENPALLQLSTVRAVYGGIESSDIPDSGTGGIAGTHLDLQLSTLTAQTTISFVQSNPYTPAQLQVVMQAALAQVDPRIVVRAISNHAGSITRIRIDAPFPITVLSTSTLPLFTAGQSNGAPTGTAGAAVGVQTYLLDRSAQFLDIELNDFLCIAGIAYRISGVVDVSSDPWPFQRVVLIDTLPLGVGSVWSIAGTVVSQDLNFWTGLCEQSDEIIFEVLNIGTQQLSYVDGVVLGVNAVLTSNLPVDATPVGQYLAQPAVYSVFLSSVLRRRYVPIDPLLVDVPLLQEFIVATDDTQVLRRSIDYFFDTFRGAPCLRFVTPVPSDAGGPDVWQSQSPPNRLWAETSYLDNRPRIEGNFGAPAGFTLDDLSQLPSNIDYLSTVQGLWYAYFNGPTMFNLRVGTQILIGLPFADETGTVIEIRSDFSVSTGLILVQDVANTAVVRSYSYPVSLALEINPNTKLPYAVGDTVQQFAPLVTGAVVEDYISNPTWFQGILEQGDFFEIEKFFKFLVQVNSAAFNLQALLFVQTFIRRIKPTYTYPLFVIQAEIGNTEVSVSDAMTWAGTLSMFESVCFPGTEGVATMFDQPDPNGGWRNQFDHNQDRTDLPTFPNPNYPIIWAFDKNYLCPEDFVVGTLCTTFGSSGLPTFDSIFQFDKPVYTADQATFFTGPTISVPAGPTGLPIGGPFTVPDSGTLNTVTLQLVCTAPGSPANYVLTLYDNGTAVATLDFTCGPGGFAQTASISVAVTAADILTVAILPAAGGPITVAWSTIFVEVGQAVSWAFDVAISAGSYCSFRNLSPL